MTSSKPKKILIKTLPWFEPDLYANLTLSDLVVFALSYLEERGVIPTTEEIVSICFRLFPSSFALKNYPRWPDSALVIRRLNDAREKKLVKGNPNDGFALTYKGKQVAKRTSKALGIEKKITTKKKKPAALVVTKKTLLKKFRKPIRSKLVKKKVIKPLAKKTIKVVTPKLEKKVVKPVAKKAVIAKPIVKKPAKKKVVKQEKKKIAKAVAIKTNKKVVVKQKSQPKQLTLALTTPAPVKKKVEVKKQTEIKKEAAKPVKMEMVITPASVSKEEKEKASKVIKNIERSDAYRLYTKNGKQSKISEFDFRNMLFATMESSSDTLTRNVALFKKYANMHSRHDVITFLNFCEDSFAKLLKKR